jgi:hypothetical protein
VPTLGHRMLLDAELKHVELYFKRGVAPRDVGAPEDSRPCPEISGATSEEGGEGPPEGGTCHEKVDAPLPFSGAFSPSSCDPPPFSGAATPESGDRHEKGWRAPTSSWITPESGGAAHTFSDDASTPGPKAREASSGQGEGGRAPAEEGEPGAKVGARRGRKSEADPRPRKSHTFVRDPPSQVIGGRGAVGWLGHPCVLAFVL